MILELPRAPDNYRSPCQISRVITEMWATQNLYCPACECDELEPTKTNTPAVDLTCPECRQPYQLKSRRHWSDSKIIDSAYGAMISAIRGNHTPNLFVLHYNSNRHVENLLVVPRFFFTESVIEKRKPLSSSARRAGWVGCNILLRNIPCNGRISIVSAGNVIDKQEVRLQYQHIRPVEQLTIERRGWVLDVLRVVQSLNKSEFALVDVYAFESELATLHPDNHNIRPKIRQQLQVLRDLGFIEFLSPGHYALTKKD